MLIIPFATFSHLYGITTRQKFCVSTSRKQCISEYCGCRRMSLSCKELLKFFLEDDMNYKSRVQAHRILQCLQNSKNVSSRAITAWYNERYPPTMLFNILTGDRDVIEYPVTEDIVQNTLEEHCSHGLLLIRINCESITHINALERHYTLTRRGASLAHIPL